MILSPLFYLIIWMTPYIFLRKKLIIFMVGGAFNILFIIFKFEVHCENYLIYIIIFFLFGIYNFVLGPLIFTKTKKLYLIIIGGVIRALDSIVSGITIVQAISCFICLSSIKRRTFSCPLFKGHKILIQTPHEICNNYSGSGKEKCISDHQGTM